MICFDTSLLIWGVEKQAHPSQQDMIERTSRYIALLKQDKQSIMVPSIVLAEFLAKCTRRNAVLAAFEKHFRVFPFDAKAAKIVGELEANRDLIQQVRGVSKVPRQCLKSDVMIIATAIAHNATKIVTENRYDFHQIAQGKIAVTDILEATSKTDKNTAKESRNSSSQHPLFDDLENPDLEEKVEPHQ